VWRGFQLADAGASIEPGVERYSAEPQEWLLHWLPPAPQAK
jgi:hypothetical protein